MQRNVDHGQAGRRQHLVHGAQVEHHGEVVDAAEIGQQFRVARIVVPRAVQRLFLQGRGDDGIDLAGQRQPRGRQDGVVGRLPRPGVELSRGHG